MNWFLFALKNTFNFKGRARRREFGWFHFINLIIGVVLSVFADLSKSIGLVTFADILAITYNLYSYGLTLTVISLAIRRLHDMGVSGWLLLSFYIPLAVIYSRSYQLTGSLSLEMLPYSFEDIIIQISSLVLFIAVCIMTPILAFVDGDKKPNKYGDSPKYPNSAQAE